MSAGTNIAGKYLLEAPLAQGGMGSVWRARHLDLEVEVAIKLISNELGANEQALARFRREARAAAQLRSPHVVQILDYGVWEGSPYIAMELLKGHDLQSELDEHGKLPLDRVKGIAAQVCKALRIAHKAGIVHRDLKPANVFLAEHAGDEVVKLLDFGIAKEDAIGGKITGGSTLLGSPLYMSPEQAAGEAVDHRSDLWSLGVVLFELLTGSTPFDGKGMGALFNAIANGPTPLPSAQGVSIDGLDAFIERCLQKDRANRYQSVRELFDAFVRIGEPGSDTLAALPPSRSATSLVPDPPAPTQRPNARARTAVDADAETRAAPVEHASAPPRGRESNTLDLAASAAMQRVDRTTVSGQRHAWLVPMLLGMGLSIGVGVFLATRGDPGPTVAASSEQRPVRTTHPGSETTVMPGSAASPTPPDTPVAQPTVPASTPASSTSASSASSTSATPPASNGAKTARPSPSTLFVPPAARTSSAPALDPTFGL